MFAHVVVLSILKLGTGLSVCMTVIWLEKTNYTTLDNLPPFFLEKRDPFHYLSFSQSRMTYSSLFHRSLSASNFECVFGIIFWCVAAGWICQIATLSETQPKCEFMHLRHTLNAPLFWKAIVAVTLMPPLIQLSLWCKPQLLCEYALRKWQWTVWFGGYYVKGKAMKLLLNPHASVVPT